MKIEVKKVNSPAEDLFVQLFCEVFGAHNNEAVYVQYPFIDIYGGHRTIDFALQNEEMKIAIEIDGETYHNPKKISNDKYFDDLLKQNSLTHQDWKVFRWAYLQLKNNPEKIKDELMTFLGRYPYFKQLDTFLPKQRGKIIELHQHQKEALQNLKQMREDGETIALLYHATGIGKTITAASDAKSFGGRTLFLVNALKLADQAQAAFNDIWPEADSGKFTGEEKVRDKKIIFATIQSICRALKSFRPDEFNYIIIDECHHAPANTYKTILSYFTPKFILGLTATPERMDGDDLLEMFCNVAHKMDLKTAVERNELVPICCLRVKTDIDLSSVRINGIKYNALDLESKLFVPERNILIANTYQNYIKNKKTVIFCASVKHAEEIANIMKKMGIAAASVKGSDSSAQRNHILNQYEHGDINVLCACDLLNEGWDSPHTEVLFMARPTMSKTIYMQQIGRGTRKSPGKEQLLVVDFVDNANMFNTPYSCHRLLNLSEYRPGEYVLAPNELMQKDKQQFLQGEKPIRILDLPIDINDFEIIDIFKWQDRAAEMISELEFTRMVNVQSETIAKYIKERKIIPDFIVEFSQTKHYHYFEEETIKEYCQEFGWTIINTSNIKRIFFEFIEKMDMSFSYKPVLLKAIFEHINNEGKVKVTDLIDYFINYYSNRRMNSLIIEKPTSVYCKEEYTKKEVEHNILANPFKRFADMRFLRRTKDIEYIEINPAIFDQLINDDIEWIISWCDKKLSEYYDRLANRSK